MVEINLPQRERIHPVEGEMQRALCDRSICLLWNARRGYWQVANYDPTATYVQPKLAGTKEVPHLLFRSNWLWVLDSARIIPQRPDDDRTMEPVEPGPWLIEFLQRQSQWTRPDVPERCRKDPQAFVAWLQEKNELADEEEEERDREQWIRDITREMDAMYRRRTSIYVPRGTWE